MEIVMVPMRPVQKIHAATGVGIAIMAVAALRIFIVAASGRPDMNLMLWGGVLAFGMAIAGTAQVHGYFHIWQFGKPEHQPDLRKTDVKSY